MPSKQQLHTPIFILHAHQYLRAIHTRLTPHGYHTYATWLPHNPYAPTYQRYKCLDPSRPTHGLHMDSAHGPHRSTGTPILQHMTQGPIPLHSDTSAYTLYCSDMTLGSLWCDRDTCPRFSSQFTSATGPTRDRDTSSHLTYL